MHAYAIQDSKGMVKLDAMENPHRLPAKLQAELGQRLGALALNRYPDGRVNDLRKALSHHPPDSAVSGAATLLRVHLFVAVPV